MDIYGKDLVHDLFNLLKYRNKLARKNHNILYQNNKLNEKLFLLFLVDQAAKNDSPKMSWKLDERENSNSHSSTNFLFIISMFCELNHAAVFHLNADKGFCHAFFCVYMVVFFGRGKKKKKNLTKVRPMLGKGLMNLYMQPWGLILQFNILLRVFH